MAFSWTDERIKEARDLWDLGWSGGQIARKMGGGLTASAIIGKIYRLVLQEKKKDPNWVPSPVRSKKSELNSALPAQKSQKSLPRGKITATSFTDVNGPTMEVEEVVEIVDDIPIAQRRTLVELRATNCRWPIGDPLKSDFYFCGFIKDESEKIPYCQHHMQRSAASARRPMNLSESERMRRRNHGKNLMKAGALK